MNATLKQVLELSLAVAIGLIITSIVSKMLNMNIDSAIAEPKAGASGNQPTPCKMAEYNGVTCEQFCKDSGGTWNPDTGQYGGCSGLNNMGPFQPVIRRRRMRSLSM